MKVMTMRKAMLARVLIQAWTKPRVADLAATTEQTREYARIFELATSEFGSTATFCVAGSALRIARIGEGSWAPFKVRKPRGVRIKPSKN